MQDLRAVRRFFAARRWRGEHSWSQSARISRATGRLEKLGVAAEIAAAKVGNLRIRKWRCDRAALAGLAEAIVRSALRRLHRPSRRGCGTQGPCEPPKVGRARRGNAPWDRDGCVRPASAGRASAGMGIWSGWAPAVGRKRALNVDSCHSFPWHQHVQMSKSPRDRMRRPASRARNR